MTYMVTLCIIVSLFFCPDAYASTYKYTDDNGVVHFTDNPSNLQNNLYRTLYTHSHSDAIRQAGFESNVIKEQLFAGEIESAASKYAVDPHFVRAIIKAESDFNPYAVSEKGALGLMQLIPETAKKYDVEKPFDPEQNIEGGVRYLKDLFSLFDGNLKKIVAAYNAGESMVKKYNDIPPFRETQHFVKRVISYYKKYKSNSNKKIFKITSKEGTVIFTDSPGNYLYFK